MFQQTPRRQRQVIWHAQSDKPGTQPLGGLSVDVEDYYHVEAFADRIRPETWAQFPSAWPTTRDVSWSFSAASEPKPHFSSWAGLLSESRVWCVKYWMRVTKSGAIAIWHRCVWRLGPEQFREDTRRGRVAIEDADQQKVYRAPTFSIIRKSLWAIEVVAEEGFLYDSSVFPIRHDL